MQTWFRLPCRCIPEMSQRNRTSEKSIQEMKERYKVTGKTVQVADKGLNCARNIYVTVIEAGTDTFFSKSVHGKGLSEKKKNNGRFLKMMPMSIRITGIKTKLLF